MDPSAPVVSDNDVLELVRRHWWDHVDRVAELPGGSRAARHWLASQGFRPLLVVTLDRLGPDPDGSASRLESAYSAAGELAFRLDFVVAGLPNDRLTYTVPMGDSVLSVAPWVHGERREVLDVLAARDTAWLLERLHRARIPRDLPRWEPLDPVQLAAWLGPRASRPDVRRMLAEHHRLAALAAGRPWVVTHGAAHPDNQLVTVVRTLLVDWASVALAPRERDLHALVEAGHGELLATELDPDPEMLELFDLEQRLEALLGQD